MVLQNGYEMQTTFGMDFTIADAFGEAAVEDTFNRAFGEWKDNYVYLTELVIVLNHKLWEWWSKGNEPMARLYDKLWRQAGAYAVENLKGDELRHFFKVTD